ncbi:MAG: hypothetical protein K2N51_20840 [Lachnospiraceae bacterium]|nr:hypothetical protein [Lachnospiraceae bacterium]
MSTDKIQETIEKELENGKLLEEIYVKYDNLYIDEVEKPLNKRNEQKKNEYLEIRDKAAKTIVVAALFKKGYDLAQGRWKKEENKQ